jgi:hypothetical protein
MSGRRSVPCALAAVPERVTSCSKLVMTKALRGGMAGASLICTTAGLSTSTRSLKSVIRVIR